MVMASLGQATPHPVDQGPKSLLYQTAPFYPPKNPVPPSDISNTEKSVPLDQKCRSGGQDHTHNTESRGSLSTKYQNSLRKSAYSCHLTQAAKLAD